MDGFKSGSERLEACDGNVYIHRDRCLRKELSDRGAQVNWRLQDGLAFLLLYARQVLMASVPEDASTTANSVRHQYHLHRQV